MRAASLAFASIASIIGLVFPFLLARQATATNQFVLLFLLAGTVGAFIYGAGFHPVNIALRFATSPLVTWALIIGGGVTLFALR